MLSRDTDYYFYLGGIVSFSLFLFFSVLFVLFLMQHSRIKQLQLNSADYISVNLDSIPMAAPKKVQKSKRQKKSDETDKTLETIEVPTKQVNTDLSSLFGEVKTKKLVKRNKSKKVAVDEKFIKKIQKRIKTKDTKQVSSTEASSLVKNMRLSKERIKVVGNSSGVVDEYLAKIHAQIYSKFFPPAESAGRSAKVRLEIDSYGELVSYRVIAYSGDTLFDEAVDFCLTGLSQFEVHPDNKAISLDIILTAKE